MRVSVAMVFVGVLSVGAAAVAQQSSGTKQSATKAAPKAAPKVTLPPAIEGAFKQKFPGATIKNVSKEKENGVEQYEIESVDNGQPRDLIYKPDGTLVLYEELIKASDVPAAVTTAIKTRFPKAIISRCEKLFQDGKMNYEIVLKNVKPTEVVLTPEGKWVTPQ